MTDFSGADIMLPSIRPISSAFGQHFVVLSLLDVAAGHCRAYPMLCLSLLAVGIGQLADESGWIAAFLPSSEMLASDDLEARLNWLSQLVPLFS